LQNVQVQANMTVMGKFATLANPSFFMGLTDKVLPWLAAFTAALFAVGLYLSFTAPPDYQQGETARIMFIHVPAAWLAMMCYTVIAISSVGSLIWRHPLADVSAKTAAPIGAAFTLLALITGSLWGKPMWGTYWVWDARLTSVLVLFFLYLGLIALWDAIEEPTRAGRAAAILALVGFINIPIIKFSVDWWNTLHQPASVMRLEGSTIHPSLLVPLLVMAIAHTSLFLWLHAKAMRAEILRRRVEAMTMLRVSRAAELKAAE
jgi:heme exporter protein C